jgi:hypothetical protein
MSWQSELRKAIEAIPEGGWTLWPPFKDDYAVEWLEVTILIDATSGLAIFPLVGCVNASELAGMARGLVMLASLGHDRNGPFATFNVRRIIPWNRAVIWQCPGGKVQAMDYLDAAGQPAHPYVEFPGETWLDRPALF